MPRTEPAPPPAAIAVARRRAVLWSAFVLAMLIHLASLYTPSISDTVLFTGADKIAHVALFLIVVTPALLLRFPTPLVISVALAHAGISEMVQQYLIPGRGGSVWDMVADVVGIGAGFLLARALRRVSVRPFARR